MDNNFDENKPNSNNAFSEENFSEAPAEPLSGSQPTESVIQNEQNVPAPETASPGEAEASQQPGTVTQEENNISQNGGGYSQQPGGTAPQPGQNIPPMGMQQNPGGYSQQPVQQGFPGGGIPPYAQPYPQAYPQYVPNQGGAYPFQEAPKEKKFSGGCFWAMLVTIVVLCGVAVLLAAMIASQVDRMKTFKETGTLYESGSEKAPEERVTIEIPTSRKPVLEEELYQNKETGLLTTVGVAEMVLPSQVKIEIFGELPYISVGSGSGIIISTDGYILTNAHVVDGAEHLSVKFYDGSREEARVVGMDRKSDLAVVKVSRTDLAAAEIGTSSDLVIGEEIALAGAGGGFENTVTYGHVTGLDREINTDYISSSAIHCIQTDAALNPGNSGGALVNMAGQVGGVAVALMNHETYENIGFSIAIDDAVPIAEELIANGYVSSRSRVGISYLAVGDSMANSYEIMPGLCVTEIDPTSNVPGTGIRLYDVIIQIDDVRVFGGEEVAEALAGKVPGDTVQLTVFRRTVTGENSIFEVPLELIPDTGSISGYSESISSEDFFGRDIIS